MNAGLFQAVRSSGLFSVDPDIGVGESCGISSARQTSSLTVFAEIDNPEALVKYYRLLLSVTRIITAVILARGPKHDQTVECGRSFLAENRALVVAIFKRQAKIGGVSFDDAGVNIEELVELFTLLISMTDFLAVSPSLAVAITLSS